MARVTVHVTPRSGKDQIVGWRGAELGVRVTAAPEGGKANSAVEKLIAGAVGVSKSRVSVVRGHTARIKAVEIEGVEQSDVDAVLGMPDDSLF